MFLACASVLSPEYRGERTRSHARGLRHPRRQPEAAFLPRQHLPLVMETRFEAKARLEHLSGGCRRSRDASLWRQCVRPIGGVRPAGRSRSRCAAASDLKIRETTRSCKRALPWSRALWRKRDRALRRARTFGARAACDCMPNNPSVVLPAKGVARGPTASAVSGRRKTGAVLGSLPV